MVVFLGWLVCCSYGFEVAVIGGGIGGGSLAFYLSVLDPEIGVTVYERNGYVGGRLDHTTISGNTYNVGGDVWSEVNQYMVELQEALDIPLDDTVVNGSGIGVYSGRGVWLDLQEGLDAEDVRATAAATTKFRVHLSNNYRRRGATGTFSSISEYLAAGSLDTYVAQSTQSLFDGLGVSQAFLDVSVLPVCRTIYDSGDLSLNAFAGFASVLSGSSRTYATRGGNDVFVQTLLANAPSATVLLRTPVTDVARLPTGRYRVTAGSDGGAAEYDAVVLAAPVEGANLTLTGITRPGPARDYRHWYVSLVEAAAPNPDFFLRNPVPDNIYTTHNSTTVPFVVASIVGNSASGQNVYKLFSNKPVAPFVTKLFLHVTETYVRHWPYTFPPLLPTESDFQPIILDDNVYYTSAMESVAVAMEASVTAARNIALLITERNHLM